LAAADFETPNGRRRGRELPTQRCLTGHPVCKSTIIGAAAGLFWELWLIIWYLNRRRIADQWRAYQQAKQPALAG